MQPLQICIGPIIRIGRESWCLPYAGFFLTTFDHLRLFKRAGGKNSVQKPNTFPEANNINFYAVLSHFEKCRDLRVKVLHNCPN